TSIESNQNESVLESETTKTPDSATEETSPEDKPSVLPEENLETKEPIVERNCVENQTRPCFDEAKDLIGKGICKSGIQTCLNNQWSPCERQIPPRVPLCNAESDNNCDGLKDTCIKGAWCEGKGVCLLNQTCHNAKCMTTCDPTQGIAKNLHCAREQHPSICFETGPQSGICKAKCNPKEGDLRNPKCEPGTYCLASTQKEYIPGFCTPNAPPTHGLRKEGEVCADTSIQTRCNGYRGLVCALVGPQQTSIPRCVRSCNPNITTSCRKGEVCMGTKSSFTGGVCY
ncbi:MAG: hypothetical protein AAGJ35_02325, partial [Myxococcota bacterium]